METVIEKYDLAAFEELKDLLLRNFPDFWTRRFAQGKYSFPYDLELFVLREKESRKMIGTIGIHDYRVLCEGETLLLAGVCDVGVDPDYRKQGFAGKMVAFVKEYAQRDPAYCGMALYTEKPWAYYSSGFTVYEPELPPEERFSSNGTESGWISLAGRNREDPLRCTVLSIYENAPSFPGKCIRSSKTWEEIFEEEKHLFRIQEQSFILRKEGRILEAYSPERSYCDSGSFEEHILMTLPFKEEDLFARAIREKRFLFPVADTF